jgi:hypothetical protein
MGKLNFSASALTDAEDAARALRAFADERSRIADATAERDESRAAFAGGEFSNVSNVSNVDFGSGETRKTSRAGGSTASSEAASRVPSSSPAEAPVEVSVLSGSKHARLLRSPVMPTETQLLLLGRHDLRWALRVHDRRALTALGGFVDPNRADPRTGKSLKMRLGYGEARAFMRNALRGRIRSARRFRDWSASGNRPWFIPADPAKYYDDRGTWVDWEDFLGVSKPANNPQRVRSFLEYDEAKGYMRRLRHPSGTSGVPESADARRPEDAGAPPPPETSSAYKRWASSGARPRNIPRDPARVYGARGEWVSWDDFLGRAPGATRRGRRPGKTTDAERQTRISR